MARTEERGLTLWAPLWAPGPSRPPTLSAPDPLGPLDLKALSFAVWLSRLARRRVRQNLGFAFGVIGVLVLSSFFGLPLWLGVVGHEGSTLLVVLNGLRLLWEQPP